MMAVRLRWTDFLPGRDVCGLVGLLACAIAVVVLLYNIIHYAKRSLSRPRPPRPEARGFEVIPSADPSPPGDHESHT
jgi:hypothetical protein